jgi:hypothetical protein
VTSAEPTAVTRGSLPGGALRLRGPLLTGGAVLLATAALHLRDPHVAGSWGICPTALVTGMDCPGCGGLRAVHELTDLDLVGAVSSNALFVLSIPLLVGLWWGWTRRAWQGERWQPGRRAGAWLALGLVVTVAFTVLRNLPGSWLAS